MMRASQPDTTFQNGVNRTMIDAILEHYPDEDIVYANGLDDAIVGIESTSMRLVYAVPQCIDILVELGMPFDEALEIFDFNVR